MSESITTGPVLFCYDGSEGSQSALIAAAQLLDRPVDAAVVTVWERVAVRLALAGAFAAEAVATEVEADQAEESRARAAAEQGAQRANQMGYQASPMVKEATEGVARAIIEVADELSARLVVCGQRGRGLLRSALLGSVSHALASHARRPVLIAPNRPQ
jgi:nucleotide-binding universal stress UspA family protein